MNELSIGYRKDHCYALHYSNTLQSIYFGSMIFKSTCCCLHRLKKCKYLKICGWIFMKHLNYVEETCFLLNICKHYRIGEFGRFYLHITKFIGDYCCKHENNEISIINFNFLIIEQLFRRDDISSFLFLFEYS